MISCKKLFLATAIALAFHGYDVQAAPLVQAATQLPDFVYQGRLDQDGTPVNGNVNLKFKLWDQQTGGVHSGTLWCPSLCQAWGNTSSAGAVQRWWFSPSGARCCCLAPMWHGRPGGLRRTFLLPCACSWRSRC